MTEHRENISRYSLARATRLLLTLSFASVLLMGVLSGCERRPYLHLHYGGKVETDLPIVELRLDVFWDYTNALGIDYDWQAEWYYGWNDKDKEIFGEIGYTQPKVFNLRRYFTGNTPYAPHNRVLADMVNGHSFSASYNWGFWDILAWNEVHTLNGVQSLYFDEETSLDRVIASTNPTMTSVRYQAPRYTRAFHQPEELFSAYTQAIDINENLDGFVYDEERDVWVKAIDKLLEPRTYIYLTQVILHHNSGKIVGVSGSANLSGMAKSVNLNTGVAGSEPITVNYNVRFKTDCSMKGENVDIAGGRLMTFGMCNVNGSRVGRNANGSRSATRVDDGVRHYMDVNMLFNNGKDSTFVFDVTEQVRHRYKGGVLTVELDMDTIQVPKVGGGSGFDAVVKEFEDGGTHQFTM